MSFHILVASPTLMALFLACWPENKHSSNISKSTRDVFYVRREVDLMKTAKVNAYIMHIFGKIELLSIHAAQNYFKMHYLNDF